MIGGLRASRGHVKPIRLLFIGGALLLYADLLFLDLQVLPQASTNTPLLLLWVRFGFSGLVALLFLTVGSLVWLYARSRQVALLLFGFSCAGMVSFAVQTGAIANDPLLSALGAVSSIYALTPFAILLLLFPRNVFSQAGQEQSQANTPMRVLPWRTVVRVLLRGYVVLILALSMVEAGSALLRHLSALQPAPWWDVGYYGFFLCLGLGIVFTSIISYRQASSIRERQQRRLFVGGVVVAFLPLLVLTVLPKALLLPPQYIVDSQLSTLPIILLPITLGYAILRYQVLAFDTLVCRAATRMICVLGLTLLTYLIIVLASFVLHGTTSSVVLWVLVAMVMLGPGMWTLLRAATERLFFTEIWQYRQLVEQPDLLGHETLGLEEMAQMLMGAVMSTFEAPVACLFVLDEETGRYHLEPPLSENGAGDVLRRSLLQQMQQTLSGEGDWLEVDSQQMQQLAQVSRPLLLHEVGRLQAETVLGLERYLVMEDGGDPLLAPVWAKGRIIAVVVAGGRGDHQAYAGPDLEAMHWLLARFAPALETARLYAEVNRHATLLKTFFGASAELGMAFPTIEDLAAVAARVSAESLSAGAEIWLYQDQELRCVSQQGSGPRLPVGKGLAPGTMHDGISWFFEVDGGRSVPGMEIPQSAELPCWQGEPLRPTFPCAWLPLVRGKQQLGVLVLTFARPHRFTQEERHILEMFARQCAAALENARMTLDLRKAYERQQELDRLKDQFIITTSHELRTPLTAVQGYIELLGDLGSDVPAELRDEFIATARHNCEELTLMVNTIMDVGRIEVDVKQILLREMELAKVVTQSMELLAAQIRREERILEMVLPAQVSVLVDELRLRQVLVNLVGNALKYSPMGSPLLIQAQETEAEVLVRVRDQGLGVPPEQQPHIFDRFVRLERDLNSPVRGTGLGLFISKQLVEAMGGRLWVESSGLPGEGSTFCFTLQRPRANVQQQEQMQEELRA